MIQSIEQRATAWTAGVRFLAEARDFSLHNFQTGPGDHPASYQIGNGGSVPRESHHSPKSTAEVIRLRGVVLNQISRGITLSLPLLLSRL
jgi:hypothetical protein